MGSICLNDISHFFIGRIHAANSMLVNIRTICNLVTWEAACGSGAACSIGQAASSTPKYCLLEFEL